MLSVSGSKIDIIGGAKPVKNKSNKVRAPKTIKQVNSLINNSSNVIATSKKKIITTQEVITAVKTVREVALSSLESTTGNVGKVSIKFNHYNKSFPIFNGVLKWEDVDNEYAFSFVYKGKYFRKISDISSGMMIQADADGDYFINLVDGQALIVQVEEGEEGIGAEGIRLKEGPLKLATSGLDDVKRANKQVDNLTKELLNMDVSNLQSDEAKRIREERDIEDILFSGT